MPGRKARMSPSAPPSALGPIQVTLPTPPRLRIATGFALSAASASTCAPPNLDAYTKLYEFSERLLHKGDLAEPNAIELPMRRYKAAFSIQTMHHLSDEEKAAAFEWAAGLVEPGGLVVVVDRVRIEEPLFEDWLVAWRRIDATGSGTFPEHLEELAKAGDRPALLEDQLAWMRMAGLHACCLHLYGNRALLVGRKPG